jgi:small ligand-binding sensory domain FIST
MTTGSYGTQPAFASAGTGNAWARAALATSADWRQAAGDAVSALDLPGRPDLALVFIDSRHWESYGEVLQFLQRHTDAALLAGCSGDGVIGPGIEAEEQPSVSIMAFGLPGARLVPVAFVPGRVAAEDLQRIEDSGVDSWLAFVDPFTVNTENLVQAVHSRRPGAQMLGGMASAHNRDLGSAVFLDGEAFGSGAVLVGIGGAVSLRAVVAQGAEPIGQPWTITECDRNVVQTIGLRNAMDVLMDTLGQLDDETRERAQRNLLVGLAMDEYRDEFGRGDYLIRNLMGGDRETGAIAINAVPRVGQTFQFQFRDARAADDDLRSRLSVLEQELEPGEEVLGALLCACNGRGRGLFGLPNHDAGALAEVLGPLPTAGLFCNGEIGPVGKTNFVHGFTASIALLTTRGETASD